MIDTYRTRYRPTYYDFDFAQGSDGTWRIYIPNPPSYAGRPSDGHSTHRYTDGARQWVCWDHDIRSLTDARKVAKGWAERTQRYIHTGIGFEEEL